MTRVKDYAVYAGILSIFMCPATRAIDHKNLDEGRPISLEDSYAIAHGEVALETGAGFNLENQASNRALAPFQIVYGAFPNFQLEAGTLFLSSPREVTGPSKSGDLELSGLYNFNQETLILPALGLKFSVHFPTGVESSGVDFELKKLMQKAFGPITLYLNGAYALLSGTSPGERNREYRALLGASYPVGAPKHTRTTLLLDLFTAQSSRLEESNHVGTELGVRYQLTQRTVLDAGAGSEFAGPEDRSALYLRAGLSTGF